MYPSAEHTCTPMRSGTMGLVVHQSLGVLQDDLRDMKSRYEIDISNPAVKHLRVIRDRLHASTPGIETFVLGRLANAMESVDRLQKRFARMKSRRRNPMFRSAAASGCLVAIVIGDQLVRVLRIFQSTPRPPKIKGI